MVSISFLDP